MFDNKGYAELPFRDYAQIIDGDRGKNYPKSEELYDNEYCLFLSAKNVTKNGFKFEAKQFISKEKDKLLKKGKLKRGDIVITTRGTVGNIAYYDKSIPFENIRINSGMVIIRKSELEYNQIFFVNAFKNKIDEILGKVTGAAQPQLPIGIMNNISISYPPIELQNEFAAFVERIDKSKFIDYSRYFLCDILTFDSSTIAYSSVVSIFAWPSIFCTCSIGIPLSIAFVAIVLLNL